MRHKNGGFRRRSQSSAGGYGQKPMRVHLVYPCAPCDITKAGFPELCILGAHFRKQQQSKIEQAMFLFHSEVSSAKWIAVATSLQHQCPAFGYLGHVHQFAGQLLDFILTWQHCHVVLVRPAVKQQPGNWQKQRQGHSLQEDSKDTWSLTWNLHCTDGTSHSPIRTFLPDLRTALTQPANPPAKKTWLLLL